MTETTEVGQRPTPTQRWVVEGQEFHVTPRAGEPGVCDVTWVSGPDPGYGFTSFHSDGRAHSAEDVERAIRGFLEDVDPRTGHLT